jgi:hypothetical protein
MSLTKFASLESAEVLELKSSPGRVKTASLNKMGEFNDYSTEDGYLYARIRAISSRVNKNHDGWPTAELAGGSEAWEKIASKRESSDSGLTMEASKDDEYGYSTFLGKPVFVDHNNSNPDRARGVIVDSKFNVLDSKTSANDEYWTSGDADPEHLPATEVELLLEIDAKSFPKLAKAIVDGDLDGFSMGCDVDYSKCSHCGHEASTPDEYCSHIQMKGAEHDFKTADGHKTSKKSYENCYGIKFFEISAVFDPADETALAKEIRHEGNTKEAGNNPFFRDGQWFDVETGKPVPSPMTAPRVTPSGQKIYGDPNPLPQTLQQGGGMYSPDLMMPVTGEPRYDRPGLYEGLATEEMLKKNPAPPKGLIGLDTPRRQGSFLASKIAEAPEPQEFHTKAPEDVDTLREEKVCPLCGSDMEGEKCDVCGYDEPPAQLQNPDLTQAQDTDLTQQDTGEAVIPPGEEVPPPADGAGESYLNAKNPPTTAGVISDMRWTPRQATEVSQGDEPVETVTSDQDTPVTSAFRTAKDMIQAAKRNQKENTMSDQTKVAADPADPSGKAKKQVDVTGTGGVDDASAEAASKPDFKVDPTGKGGISGDNKSTSSPDKKESLPSGEQDNAGFQNGGQTGPDTQTFPNTNEPDSAVTDKAFPTSANKGTQPADPVGKAQDRIDVEQPPHDQVGDGTKTWSGTSGNGVTKQQDPVTSVPTQSGGIKASGLISLAALKLADTEVELGLIEKEDKYNRLTELAEQTDEEIAAAQVALSKVKTAGLSRTASNGGVGRLPSFKRVASEEAPEAQPVNDELLDNALYS